MDYDPITGQAKAPRRPKERRGFSRGPKAPSKAQWGKLREVLGLAPTQPGAEAFARFANGYHMGELTSIHLMLAINLAMNGEGPYGTAEELCAVSMGADFPDPRLDLLVRAYKRAAKRKAHSDGTSSSKLSAEQLSARSLAASKRTIPVSSNVPSRHASKPAHAMRALDVLAKRRLRLATISAAKNDGAQNLDGPSVENTAPEESPCEKGSD